MKDYRKAIYDFVETNVGEIKPEYQIKFSNLLHEFMSYAYSAHKEHIEKLQGAVNKLRTELKAERIKNNIPKVNKQKPNELPNKSSNKTTAQHSKSKTSIVFNRDFFNKG